MILAFFFIAFTSATIQAVPYETNKISGTETGVREMTGSLFERSSYPESYEDLLEKGVGFDAAISFWLSQLDIEKAYEESKKNDSAILKQDELSANFSGVSSSSQIGNKDDTDFPEFL